MHLTTIGDSHAVEAGAHHPSQVLRPTSRRGQPNRSDPRPEFWRNGPAGR